MLKTLVLVWGLVLCAWSVGSAQGVAYVLRETGSNATPGTVELIDLATNTVVGTVGVGRWPRHIAITPDESKAYVSNFFSDTVSVINTATNAVSATIPIPRPAGLAVTPDGSRVYVGNATDYAVVVVDTGTNTVLATIPLGSGLFPFDVAITPDGTRAYVLAGPHIKVIDTASNVVTATLSGLISSPVSIAIAPVGSRAYVAQAFAPLLVLDTSTNTAVTTIPISGDAQDLLVSNDGSRVFVAHSSPNLVSVIDAASNSVISTLPVSGGPSGLAMTPDGSRLYISSIGGGVQVRDGSSFALLTTVPVGSGSSKMALKLTGLAPTAVNDAYSTNLNTALVVPASGVLANDNGNFGGAMTAQLVSNVANGTLTLTPGGGFSYAPAIGFSGTDVFSYRAANSAGLSNIATVSISVAAGPAIAQPPSGLASSIVGNTVTLSWTPPAGGLTPTGYVVEGGLDQGQVLASIATNSTSPSFTFVAPTGAFYVRVHTLSGSSRSLASNEIRIFVNIAAPPSAPTHLLGLVNGSNVALAWRNPPGGGVPTSVLLDVTGSLSATLSLPPSDNFSFANVPAGTYTLSLRASNATGTSGPSNPVTLTFPAACSGVPLTPANFLATKNGNVITVRWDPAAAGPAPTAFVLSVSGAFGGDFPTSQRALSGTVAAGSYTLSVFATNPCGSGPVTASQTVVIP